MDLQKLRQEIDGIDEQIISLFIERMKLAEGVAKFKIETGKPVFDAKREQEKLKDVAAKGDTTFNKLGIEELFRQIMAISRKRQYQLLTKEGVELPCSFTMVDQMKQDHCKVVYQGVKGAYSYAAMKAFFGPNITSYPVEQWRDAMEMVAKGKADYAVLPIENSTAGSVYDNYDLLEEYHHYIVGEQVIPCEHALLGVKGGSLTKIKKVISHPQAFMQCKTFLQEHPQWKLMEYDNTAKAALKVAMEQNEEQAAIASKIAANCYDLDILKEGIFLDQNNSTRFIIVSKEKAFTKDSNKISICFELPHSSGSLYHILSHFIYNNINMSKIESRPIMERSWEYRFFIDFEGNLTDSAVKNALRGIQVEAKALRIFGCYKEMGR